MASIWPHGASNAILEALFLISALLTRQSLIRPNPPKAAPATTDRFLAMRPFFVILRYLPLTTLFLGIAHAYITYTTPDGVPRELCPNPEHLNRRLFEWNVWTALGLPLIIAGASTRILAMAELGESFTFELAKPVAGLKTDGIYGLMQHPSYTGVLFGFNTFLALLGRFDGVVGCWLPSFLTTSKICNYGPLVVLVVFSVYIVPKRIKDEEDMLHRAFGREWEVYNKKTRRLIPWVY